MGDQNADRAATALLALERLHRQRRQAWRGSLILVVFVLMPLFTAGAFLLFVGYQRHVLELHAGSTVIRLVSREAPYDLLVGDADPDIETHGVPGWYVVESLESPRIVPRRYESAALALTKQVVTLDPGSSLLDFEINGRSFRLSVGELQSGPHRWLLEPGSTRVIEIDRLGP